LAKVIILHRESLIRFFLFMRSIEDFFIVIEQI